MRNIPVIDFQGWDAYFVAHFINETLSDRFSFIRNLNEFHCDGEIAYLAEPFKKLSAFHKFIAFCANQIFYDETTAINPSEKSKLVEQYRGYAGYDADEQILLPVELAFVRYGVDHMGFSEYLETIEKTYQVSDENDVYDYFNEIRFDGSYQEMLEKCAEEAFFVLFSNRKILLFFNLMMADVVSAFQINEIPEDAPNYFSRDGVLKRKNIPSWAKRAVFYRDRGRCVYCRADLTNLVSVEFAEYDHMVPLANGGLNDISNIQLTCQKCNNVKSRRPGSTNVIYDAWF